MFYLSILPCLVTFCRSPPFCTTGRYVSNLLFTLEKLSFLLLSLVPDCAESDIRSLSLCHYDTVECGLYTARSDGGVPIYKVFLGALEKGRLRHPSLTPVQERPNCCASSPYNL